MIPGTTIKYSGKKATFIGECSDDQTYLIVFRDKDLGWTWHENAQEFYPEMLLRVGVKGCYWLDKLNPELKKDLKILK